MLLSTQYYKGNTMKNPNTFRNIIITNACNLIQSESAQGAKDSGYNIDQAGSFRHVYTLSAMEGLLLKLDLSHEQLLILHETYAHRLFLNC
jgi:hypothetical protein